jgi:hypothetical protein
MTLEEQLRDAYERAAELAPVPPGGFDRFLRRRARRGRAAAATAGLGLVVVLGAAVLVARQLPQEREPAPPAARAAEPAPRPHQWVYEKELRVEYGSRKPFTVELWNRVDGKQYAWPINPRRTAGAPKVRKERMQHRGFLPSGCPPGQPERIRPAVGLGKFFPDPSAVPTDPDGLLAAVYRLVEDPACSLIPVGDTVQDRAFMLIEGMLQTMMPADVHAALAQALLKIPGVTVVQGVTDAAGRRGVAFVRAAAIEGPGSSDWLRLEIIMDPDTHRYLGARHVVTRDHFIPDTPTGSKGTQNRKGQVLVSRAQVALAVVDAPCQRPGETTTCVSYVEGTWVLGGSSRG